MDKKHSDMWALRGESILAQERPGTRKSSPRGGTLKDDNYWAEADVASGNFQDLICAHAPAMFRRGLLLSPWTIWSELLAATQLWVRY